MVARTLFNIISLTMILLASAAHYKDWGSSFMFEMDILEIRISSLVQQTQQTSPGLLLLMKLGAFNSCLQVPTTLQAPTQAPMSQQKLITQAFSHEQPQRLCSYGDGSFPPTLPVRTLPMEILKLSDTIFLMVSSLFIVIIVLWSLKLLVSITSYFKRMMKVNRIVDFLAILSLSLFIATVCITLIFARKLLTRRTFYNHLALNVAVEPGGGFYLLVAVLVIHTFLTVGSVGKKKRSNKIVSMEEILPPAQP